MNKVHAYFSKQVNPDYTPDDLKELSHDEMMELIRHLLAENKRKTTLLRHFIDEATENKLWNALREDE